MIMVDDKERRIYMPGHLGPEWLRWAPRDSSEHTGLVVTDTCSIPL